MSEAYEPQVSVHSQVHVVESALTSRCLLACDKRAKRLRAEPSFPSSGFAPPQRGLRREGGDAPRCSGMGTCRPGPIWGRPAPIHSPMPSIAFGRKCRMRSPATLKRSPKLAEFRAQFSNLANQVYTNRPSPRFPARCDMQLRRGGVKSDPC